MGIVSYTVCSTHTPILDNAVLLTASQVHLDTNRRGGAQDNSGHSFRMTKGRALLHLRPTVTVTVAGAGSSFGDWSVASEIPPASHTLLFRPSSIESHSVSIQHRPA